MHFLSVLSFVTIGNRQKGNSQTNCILPCWFQTDFRGDFHIYHCKFGFVALFIKTDCRGGFLCPPVCFTISNLSLSLFLTQGQKPSLPKGGGTVVDGGRILWVYANAQISTALLYIPQSSSLCSMPGLVFASVGDKRSPPESIAPLGKGAFIPSVN